MKKYYLSIIILSISIITLIFSFITFSYNSELEKTIARKDKIIKISQQKDSILGNSTKEYAQKITQYINDCSFNVDGKTISAEKLIEILSDTEYRYNRTKDSLKAYMEATTAVKKFCNENNQLLSAKIQNLTDSISINKTALRRIKKEYGITYTVKNDGKYLIVTIPSNKADSAMAVYKHYKHKLSTNVNGDFVIQTETKVKN